MVVEQINNPANKQMHYGDKPPIGVVNTPNKPPKKVLYSNAEAERLFNELQYDIYQSQKHTKAPKKGKFPTVLKIILGSLGLCSAVIFRKDLIKLVKKVFIS